MARVFTVYAAAFSTLLGTSAQSQVLNDVEKLLPDFGENGDQFGISIAIDGNKVLVGSWGDDDNGDDSGAAYVFNTLTGDQVKLLPEDGSIDDRFGLAVAIEANVAAVGAYLDDDNGQNSGSVYIFDATSGEQMLKIVPADAVGGDFFGSSVAIDNGVVAVGAPHVNVGGSLSGFVYLFDVFSGNQIAKLIPSDGLGSDQFGYSVAVADGVVAVGARRDDDLGSSSGSAYLFDVTTGVQIAKLLPDDGNKEDEFGFSIAIAGGVVAVGAHQDDDNGAESGSAYLFDCATGDQIAKLVPDDGTDGDRLGQHIAIESGRVAVGTVFDSDNGPGSGSVYLFDTSKLDLIAKMLPMDGVASQRFGSAIAVADGLFAVGARGDNENGTGSGSAYLFDTNPCSSADLSFPPGRLDFSDVVAFLTAFDAMEPDADLAPPVGQWDFSDVVAFLNSFAAGCP